MGAVRIRGGCASRHGFERRRSRERGKVLNEEAHSHHARVRVRVCHGRGVRPDRLLVEYRATSRRDAEARRRAGQVGEPRGRGAAAVRRELAVEGHGRRTGAVHAGSYLGDVQGHAVSVFGRAERAACRRRVRRRADLRLQGQDGRCRGEGLCRRGDSLRHVQERPRDGCRRGFRACRQVR